MYWVAFITGFAGSLHCIGMCGPLALAVPLPGNERWTGLLLYSLGRTITYSAFGVIAGFVGLAFSMAGFQQTLSLLLGILFLLGTLLPVVSRRAEGKIYGSGFMKVLKGKIARQFKKRTYFSAFAVGLLNGFLPCGLVYLAIAGAIVTGEAGTAGLYMIMFSVGTVPAFVLLGLIRKWWPAGFKLPVSTAMGFLLACIMIYRGIALEIPELSQLLENVGLGKITTCGPG